MRQFDADVGFDGSPVVSILDARWSSQAVCAGARISSNKRE
jgi:hypothetical protein